MKHIKTITSVAFLLLGIGGINAQESSSATGGEATGTGGTASYSVGQIAYTSIIGTNGSVSQGVQQAYEIYKIGINEIKIDISLSVYPNPTKDLLNLKIENTEGVSYYLYDLQGKLLESKAINSSITRINTSSLPRATYLIKVMKGKNQVNTYKVIKN